MKRKIITFCGSSKYHELFHKLAAEYTLMGWIVLMPHCYYENNSRPDLKELLVEIHRDMIKMSDAILVVNKDNYIGKSTNEEINYAIELNKEVKYYEKVEVNK